MSAVDTAFHGLRHMIASGRLVAGQRFPAESELCDELGVSRGSLREAVRMLAALGIIESRHGSGTYVSMLRPEEIIGSLSLTVDLLPLDGLLQMYELRRVLETHAASQAAARASDAVHSELMSLIEAMECTTDPAESSELDHRFHELIARTAGNATLTALLQVFRSRSRAYDVFSLPDGDELRRVSNRGHRSMTEAIIARDPVGAAGAASAHVAQTEEWLRVLQPPATRASD